MNKYLLGTTRAERSYILLLAAKHLMSEMDQTMYTAIFLQDAMEEIEVIAQHIHDTMTDHGNCDRFSAAEAAEFYRRVVADA